MQTIPARRGTAAIVRRDQSIKIINSSGHQVIDTWVFGLPSALVGSSARTDPPVFPNANESSMTSYTATANAAATAPEFSSMSHTRIALRRLSLETGDAIVSQKRSPMVTITEDTSPGQHDTLVPACDRWRYAQFGVQGYHESCTDNCWDALQTLSDSLEEEEESTVVQGIKWALGGRLPDPLNLFMNVPVGEGSGAKRSVSIEKASTEPGQYVVLRAEKDCVVVMSSCPQDLMEAVTGGKPADGHYQILE